MQIRKKLAAVLSMFLLPVAWSLPASCAEQVVEVAGIAQTARDAAGDGIVALSGVTVFDGTGEPGREDQVVVIGGKTVLAVGDRDVVAVPPGARVLMLPGHTVIPGIIGMHNHMHMPGITFMPFTAPRMYLAAGVTTIRTAGSAQADDEIAMAKAIERDGGVGPRMFPSAPYVTGENGNGPMTKPRNAKAARAFVREWAAKGARWLKIYRHTRPDIAAVIIDEAHRQGLKVAGHLCSLTFREAALMGIDSIEHGLISATDFVPDKAAGECVSNHASIAAVPLDSAAVRDLVALLVENDVTLTSTLAIIESHFPHRPQGDDRALAAMSPDRLDRYHARQARLSEVSASSRFQPALLQKLMAFERMFAAAGGRLVAGPDPGRHVLTGFGDQRNFELLVEAGFSVPQAIRVMTANGADALGAESIGILRPGMRADLVVIRGDLETDPSAIRNTAIVFRDGVRFDPALLLEAVRGQVGIH